MTVSPETAAKIGEKIWKNECGGSFEGLTHWNKGENFGSFGIGHFIWYPKDKRERFQETFPDLLLFLKAQGVLLPHWLDTAQGSPWETREEFYQNIQSQEMVALRQLLYDTRNLQAIFIANRLQQALPQLTQNASDPDKEHITTIFSRLSNDARGLYALIDYHNFKGLGTSPTETYKGQGWGLQQVLLRIPIDSKDVVADFVAAARALLTERVQNSPPERNEEQWLKGWLNRVNTYLT